jgi:hypothetical protein
MDDFRMVLSGTEALYVSKVKPIPYRTVHLTEITKSLILTNQFTGPGSDPPGLPRLRLQDAGVAP